MLVTKSEAFDGQRPHNSRFSFARQGLHYEGGGAYFREENVGELSRWHRSAQRLTGIILITDARFFWDVTE